MFIKLTYFSVLNFIIYLFFLNTESIYAHGLYNETLDDVIILTDNNFDQEIVGSKSSWLVEFYNSWCGHCIRFAPEWKKLATDCKGWSDVLKIGAIDCSSLDNQKICMHYKLQGYPTIMFLAANSPTRPTQYNMDIRGSTETMKRMMIDYISNRTLNNVSRDVLEPLIPIRSVSEIWASINRSSSSPPPHLPSLMKNMTTSIEKQEEEEDNEDSGDGYDPNIAIVIVESAGSYIGREIILDRFERRHRLVIRRIITDPAVDVRLPSTYLASRLDDSLVLLNDSPNKADHMLALDQLETGRRPTIRPITFNVNNNNNNNNNNKTSRPNNNNNNNMTNGELFEHMVRGSLGDLDVNWNDRSYIKLHETDLLSGLYYSLNYEIPLHSPFNKNTSLFLIDYLDDLIRYLPVNSGVLSGLQELKIWLRLRISGLKSHPVTGKNWLTAVTKAFKSTNLPSNLIWVGCASSTPGLRAYPCSLWLTFHALTINVAYQSRDSIGTGVNNSPNDQIVGGAVVVVDGGVGNDVRAGNSTDDGDGGEDSKRCLKVLLNIRGYVQRFFGCQECVQNFLKGAVKIESLVKNCHQSIIFLWRSHNKANFRLRGDRTEDPVHPKTIFPNALQCSQCFNLSYFQNITRNISKASGLNNNNNNNDNSNNNTTTTTTTNNNNNGAVGLIGSGDKGSGHNNNSTSISGLRDGWNEAVVLSFLNGIYLKANVVPHIPIHSGKTTDDIEEDDFLRDDFVGGKEEEGSGWVTKETTSTKEKHIHVDPKLKHSRKRFLLDPKTIDESLKIVDDPGVNFNNNGVNDNIFNILNNSDGQFVDPNSPDNYGRKYRQINNSFQSYSYVFNMFTTYDYSLCVAFYLFCALLLIIFYLHFMGKRKVCLKNRIGARLKFHV